MLPIELLDTPEQPADPLFTILFFLLARAGDTVGCVFFTRRPAVFIAVADL